MRPLRSPLRPPGPGLQKRYSIMHQNVTEETPISEETVRILRRAAANTPGFELEDVYHEMIIGYMNAMKLGMSVKEAVIYGILSGKEYAREEELFSHRKMEHADL